MTCVFAKNGCMNSREGNEAYIKDIYRRVDDCLWDKDELKVCLYTNGHLNESSRLSRWILHPINLKAKWSNNLISAPSISLSPSSFGTHVSILTFGWYSCGEKETGVVRGVSECPQLSSMSMLLQGPSKLNINSPELIHKLAQCMLSIHKYTHTLKVHHCQNQYITVKKKKSRKAEKVLVILCI